MADRLYQCFLAEAPSVRVVAEPNPVKIDQLFSHAIERRTRGRPGLVMQSRFPTGDNDEVQTAWPYSVLTYIRMQIMDNVDSD